MALGRPRRRAAPVPNLAFGAPGLASSPRAPRTAPSAPPPGKGSAPSSATPAIPAARRAPPRGRPRGPLGAEPVGSVAQAERGTAVATLQGPRARPGPADGTFGPETQAGFQAAHGRRPPASSTRRPATPSCPPWACRGACRRPFPWRAPRTGCHRRRARLRRSPRLPQRREPPPGRRSPPTGPSAATRPSSPPWRPTAATSGGCRPPAVPGAADGMPVLPLIHGGGGRWGSRPSGTSPSNWGWGPRHGDHRQREPAVLAGRGRPLTPLAAPGRVP